MLGVNWTSYSSLNYSPGQYYQSLHFINEQTGWVTGNGLLKTSNGGNTWENLPLAGLGQSLRYPGSVFFPDASTGYISSTDSLAKTIDGGNTWNKIFKTYHSGLHDLHFVSPQSGYAGDGRYIMKTINGGQTWTKDVALKRENNLMELHFTNASHGWACGTLGLVLKYEQ
ncbi:MAG: YCF48-related protein [Bacteroidota bacterium]